MNNTPSDTIQTQGIPQPKPAPDTKPGPQAPASGSTEAPPTPQSPPRKPWDLQPGESPRAFEAFQRFLKLGPEATLRSLAKPDGSDYESLKQFSSIHHWRERAAAYRQDLAQTQADALKHLIAQSTALQAQRTQIIQQQRWEQADRLTDLADHARDLALDGKEIPPRLDHVARLYTVADNLRHRAVQPLPAGLLPTPQDQPLSPELEMALNKVYGPIAASGILPDLKALLDRDRLPAQPTNPPEPPASTPPAASDPPKTS